MIDYISWLNQYCDNIDWRCIKYYNGIYTNKYLLLYDENQNEQICKIIKKVSKNKFLVKINGYLQEINTENQDDIFVNFSPVTNKDFCVKSSYMYLDYFKNLEDFNLNISEIEFINKFSQIIYKNSNFYSS